MSVAVETLDALSTVPVVEFTVLGEPAPAGSKRAFRNPHSGRIQVTDASERSKPWQAEVRAAAAEAFDGEPLTGALRVRFDFYRLRPASHFGTGRNAGTVRAGAPNHPVTRPDVTKLIRAAEDAMTGIVWRDDSQVVEQYARKLYGAPPRLEVHVEGVSAA